MTSSKIQLQLLISSPDMTETISLDGEEFIFGRSSESTIHLNDSAFSRSHFKIFTENLVTKVSDLSSSNGTFINGERVISDTPMSIDFDDVITTNNSPINIKILNIVRLTPQEVEVTATHNKISNSPIKKSGISSLDSLSEEIIREADLKVEEMLSAAKVDAQELLSLAEIRSEKLIAEKQALADQLIEKQTSDRKLALLNDLEYEKQKRLLEIQIQIDSDRNALNAELEEHRLRIIANHDKKKEELNLEILDLISKLNSLEGNFESESEKQKNIIDEKFQSQKDDIAEIIKIKEEEKDKLFKSIDEECESRRQQLEVELDIYQQKNAKAQEDFAEVERQFALEADKLKANLDQKMVDHNNLLSDFTEYQKEEKNKLIKLLEDQYESRQVELQKELDTVEQKIKKSKADFIKLEQKHLREIADFANQQEEEKNKNFLLIEAQYENKHFQLENELDILEKKVEGTKTEFSALYENYNKQKLVQTQALDSLVAKKKQTSEEIISLEVELVNQKNITTSFLTESRGSIKLMQGEIEKVAKQKIEVDNNFKISRNSLSDLEKNISNMRDKVKFEEDLIQQKQQQQVSIEVKINKLITEQTDIISNLTPLKNELIELTKKNEQASRLNNDLKAEHNRDVTGLQANFLQLKKDLEAEMLRLKVIEEERLQKLTRHELSQINKLKEDSLRIVLDLEDSITRELSSATSKVFATTIGIEKFNEIAPDFEKSIRVSLKNGVLQLLKNDLNPGDPLAKKPFAAAQKSWKPLAVGMSLSALVFGGIPFIYRQVQDQNDPARLQREADARQAALPVKQKFIVQKKNKLGETFVESIIYTEGFYETITQEKFRSGLMKEGSVYMFKQWNIIEEKSIQGYSMILSMLDNLHEKSDKIDPDYEKRDIKKMEDQEKETMKKLEIIFGNAVRLEAALKFQNRYYEDYVLNVTNTPSVTP